MTAESASAPVFIVGSPRSGTTLLQSLLSASGTIAVAPEHDFLLRFLPRFAGRDFAVSGAIDEFVEAFFALPATRFWKIDPTALGTALTEARPSGYADVVRLTYERFAAQRAAPRWGAKVPFFALHLGVLKSMFPDVRVVHIVRDGRDVLASMRERARHGARHFPVDARFGALRWKQLVAAGSRGSRLLPAGHYLELRYEDLIADSTQVVGRLEDFLGCSIRAAAEHHYARALDGAVVHSEEIDRYLRPGITAASVARWQTDLTKRDVQWFEAIAGGLLREKGYPLLERHRPIGLRLLGGLTS
ncbi:MAG TPA: sulfotransferase, partial [Steroidobacteraceae bacterium]|nr:sulfotransferase [Steroidobacteraceae bacterium]